jgi:hypothetical protein
LLVQHGIVAGYIVLLPTLVACFKAASRALTEFERHPSQLTTVRRSVLKLFCLSAFARFFPLFHAAFWLRDLLVLKALLRKMLIIEQLVNALSEIGSPVLSRALVPVKARLLAGASLPLSVVCLSQLLFACLN